MLDDFVARYVRNKNQPLRSADEYESAFNRLVKPRIGKLSVYEVRRSHINEMLDKIEDENGLVMADRTLAYLRKAFNWYAARDDQFNVPVVRGMARIKPKERARTRILSDQEIRIIWPVLGEVGTFGALVKTLLLTAQQMVCPRGGGDPKEPQFCLGTISRHWRLYIETRPAQSRGQATEHLPNLL
jgi:integrase